MKSLLSIVVLVATASLAMGYSSGPPNEKTGAPGEGTCVDCHTSHPLNSGDGSLTIDAPSTYHPGETYTITVEIADPGQQRWGFELTQLGRGEITITDPTHTQLASLGNNQYIKHTSAGTFNGTHDGPIDWTFDWTAPTNDPPETITLYAAGNAADGGGSQFNDYIYTTMATLNLATGIDDYADGSLPGRLALTSYPNPFNAVTTIAYNLPVSGHINLSIYDIRGRLVKTLVSETKAAGNYLVRWDGSDKGGNAVVSGMYFVRMASGDNAKTAKLLFLK